MARGVVPRVTGQVQSVWRAFFPSSGRWETEKGPRLPSVVGKSLVSGTHSVYSMSLLLNQFSGDCGKAQLLAGTVWLCPVSTQLHCVCLCLCCISEWLAGLPSLVFAQREGRFHCPDRCRRWYTVWTLGSHGRAGDLAGRSFRTGVATFPLGVLAVVLVLQEQSLDYLAGFRLKSR